jgi:hypothetical protein
MRDAQCLGDNLVLVLNVVAGQVEAGDACAGTSEMRMCGDSKVAGLSPGVADPPGEGCLSAPAVLRGIEAEQDMAPGVAVVGEKFCERELMRYEG